MKYDPVKVARAAARRAHIDDIKTLTSILAELALVEGQVEEAEAELTKKEKEAKVCPKCGKPL